MCFILRSVDANESVNVVTTVSLLDSLDSTLDNDKKAHTVPRTSGDMDTIPEMTGERTTTTPGNTEQLEVESEGDDSSDDVESGRVAVGNSRRPSTLQIGFTLPNEQDATSAHSSNMSAKDFAGKTTSGQLELCFSACAASGFIYKICITST